MPNRIKMSKSQSILALRKQGWSLVRISAKTKIPHGLAAFANPGKAMFYG